MNQQQPRRIGELLLRLTLGGLLLWAGALKLGDAAALSIEVGNYQLVPALAPFVALFLPCLEITVGTALIAGTPPWRHAAALCALAIFAVFTAAVTTVVVRGIDVNCGCFGKRSGPVNQWTVLRDLVLLAGAAVLYRLTAPTSAPATSRIVGRS